MNQYLLLNAARRYSCILLTLVSTSSICLPKMIPYSHFQTRFSNVVVLIFQKICIFIIASLSLIVLIFYTHTSLCTGDTHVPSKRSLQCSNNNWSHTHQRKLLSQMIFTRGKLPSSVYLFYTGSSTVSILHKNLTAFAASV